MSTGLLFWASLVGPGIVLKAVTGGRFNLSAYILGMGTFFFLYFSPLINAQVPGFFLRLLCVVGLACIVLQPLVEMVCLRWNLFCRHQQKLQRLSPWLMLRESVRIKMLVLSGMVGLLGAAVFIGSDDALVAAYLPEWMVLMIYENLNREQLQLFGLLQGLVGLLLLLSFRIAETLDDSWLEDAENPRHRRTEGLLGL